jgi:hypothetical protein
MSEIVRNDPEKYPLLASLLTDECDSLGLAGPLTAEEKKSLDDWYVKNLANRLPPASFNFELIGYKEEK